jgi:hypothetical protein
VQEARSRGAKSPLRSVERRALSVIGRADKKLQGAKLCLRIARGLRSTRDVEKWLFEI